MYANMSAYLCVCICECTGIKGIHWLTCLLFSEGFRITVRNRDEMSAILTSKAGKW